MYGTQNVPFGNSGEWTGSAITRSGADKFPNPFCDIASEYVPRDIEVIFEWAEYLYLTFGTFRQASRKVSRYFLTELVLEGESIDERDAYSDFLNNDLHLLTRLAEIGDDFMVYGNVFISLYFPFDRYLICPKCNTYYHIDTLKYKYVGKTQQFVCSCGKCGHHGPFEREDRRSPDRSKVSIMRWNPKRIKLRVHPISGTTEYYLELDPNFVAKIMEGNRFFLKYTPWPIIEHCARAHSNVGDNLFRFNEDAIYHLKESTLAGLPIRGWGIPPILPNFKLAYYIQILRRYDEAIALDFIVPFRILYPEGGTVSGGINQDPVQLASMAVFKSHMERMVAAKRKNITSIQVSPFKIGYELLGGEATSLAPKDSIAQAMDELLNATGMPAELYKGTLDFRAAPVALRLFEKTWGSLVDGYNDLIGWILRKIARYYQWGEMHGSLRSVTLADDLERKALALQAAAGGDISKGTAYKPLDIDYMEEQKRVVEEQAALQKLQQEAMEEAQGQQAAGQGGGDPNAPGGQPGATPGDVHQQARDLAQQLVVNTPETLRRGELIKIKHSNPTLHALVMQYMDELRNSMASQGQAMMIQQQQQQGGMAPKTASLSLVNRLDNIPSPVVLGLLISSQVSDYTREDMRKIAMDVKRGIPKAAQAFRFVYRHMRGWPQVKTAADGLPL